MNVPQVDFILPTYQKEASLHALVERLLELFDSSSNREYRAHFILDGPDDHSESILKSFCDPRISVLVLTKNVGKGFATRAAIPVLNGDVVVTMDADLDIDPSSALRGIERILEDSDQKYGCIYGSKFHPESEVQYPITRRLASKLFKAVVRLVFGTVIDDTQTGLKIFPTAVFAELGQICKEDRFMYDLEILVLIARKGLKLEPTPVKLSYQYDSSIRLLNVIRMAVDLFLLASRLAWQDQRSLQV